MKISLKLVLWWLPPALAVTLFCGMVYATVQQVLRLGANDPQIQIAEDMATLLSSGVAPKALISSGLPVEISKSLAAYAVIFDDEGKMIVSSGSLNGGPIVFPEGVLEYTKAHGEDRITWQPDVNVRSAVVIARYEGKESGYVAVGRSMREIEKRERILLFPILLVWITLLIISFVTVFFIHRRELKAIEKLA